LNFVKSSLSYINELDRDDSIFHGYNVNMLGKKFRRLKQGLGIKEKFTYTLKTLRKTFRKTFATRMAKRGVPIHEVAYMLGHESIHTTKMYYTEVRVDNLRDEINSINNSR